MQDKAYEQLLQEKLLEKINYHTANYTAVSKLSKILEEEYNEHISETTLKRLFGLIPNQSQFRYSTLDILSQFVGYASWDKFKKENDIYISNKFTPKTHELFEEPSLLKICLKNHHFDAVLEYINQLPIDLSKNKLHIANEQEIEKKVSFVLWQHLHKDRKAALYLAPRLAKTLAGQIYFYESPLNVDSPLFLNTMEQHYSKHINGKNPDYGIRDFIFLQSMLFYKYLWQEKPKKAYFHLSKIYEKLPLDVNLMPEIRDIYPIIRYISNYLIYKNQKQSLSKQEVEKVILMIEKVEQMRDLNNFIDAYCIFLTHLFSVDKDLACLFFEKELTNISAPSTIGIEKIDLVFNFVSYYESKNRKDKLNSLLNTLKKNFSFEYYSKISACLSTSFQKKLVYLENKMREAV